MSRGFLHGVAADGGLEGFRSFESLTGIPAQSATLFFTVGTAWNTDSVVANLRRYLDRGVELVIVLQFQGRPGGGPNQAEWSNRTVIAGHHDVAIAQWRVILERLDYRPLVRLMHEGNGAWYCWGVGALDNTPVTYRDAWHRIARLLKWPRLDFCPNISFGGPQASVPIDQIYPGRRYVHRVSLNGYNGGTEVDRNGWRSFAATFEASIVETRRFWPGPVHIGETSSAVRGGNRTEWITAMWDQLATDTRIAGLTWFDHNRSADPGKFDCRLNRPDNPPGAVEAYRTGLRRCAG